LGFLPSEVHFWSNSRLHGILSFQAMAGPLLTSRIEQPNSFAGLGIPARQVWTFVIVVGQASESQVRGNHPSAEKGVRNYDLVPVSKREAAGVKLRVDVKPSFEKELEHDSGPQQQW
jgi:hypothetical protein